MKIEGIIAAVVTPFDQGENIDMTSFRRIIDHLIENGIHGLFPIGSQGEFYALSEDERRKLIDVAVEQANGRVFVMPNTGCITTRESIELSRYAEDAGVDSVSVITPFFISPSQEELFDHYGAICDAVKIPVFAYNNPARTGGTVLTASTIAKLAQKHPNFQGIKDSSGDLTLVARMIMTVPKGFKVMMGRDTLIYAALMYGASGAVAATANVAPKLVTGIYEAYRKGQYHEAKDFQEKLTPLRLAFSLGSFPVVVKEALGLMGLCSPRCRGPIRSLSEEKKEELRGILAAMQVI